LTELLMVNTETFENGVLSKGRQTNWRVNRNGRSFNTHFHWTDQNSDFDVPLGILGRNYTPDAQGLHGFVEYRFWPEDSWLDRIGPRVFFAHQEDGTGLRIYNELSPQLQMTWSGDSSFNVGSNSIKERLRPQDFEGLTETRDYSQRRYFVGFSTDTLQTIGFAGGFDVGTVINLVPPIEPEDPELAEPNLADRTFIEAELLWRPIDRLRVDTSLLSTELEDREGRGTIFTDRILRTRWNYQFTKEMSLRVIVQQEDTKPTPGLTRLTREENLNVDVLFRYVLNPWSALYVGFNNNESNLQLVENEDGTTELVRSEDLARDGRQLFVKFSYLWQP